MIETGIGITPIRRPTSWYDRCLVGRQGEDILARIDWRGIEDLRQHHLIWSSWGSSDRLPTNDLLFDDGVPPLRWICISDPRPLRLFFLSLAWRAGATTRPEFRWTPVSAAVIEDLRLRVAGEDPGAPEDYPIQLYQVVTRGAAHNRTPTLERKTVFNIDGSDSGLEIDYVRFYFDGLVAHVHLAAQVRLPTHYLHYSCLGFQKKTPVFTHRYEASRTSRDIVEMMRTVTVERSFPGSRNRISRALDDAWKGKK
jgi:hypothetical protein